MHCVQLAIYTESKLPEIKMPGENQAASGGIGFFGLLGIVFITLKLCNVINWSWWLVLLPLYGPAALILAILLIIAIVAALAALVSAIISKVK